jgi:hypothetical protein
MKATIEFNLPEENEEFNIAVNAVKYYATLHDMDEFLRCKLKYGELTKAEAEVYSVCRDKLNELRGDI